MSDIQHIRTQLRRDTKFKPPSSGLNFRFAVLVVCAAILGVSGYVFLKRPSEPQIVPLRPSVYVPTFQQVTKDPQSTAAPPAPDRLATNAARPSPNYAGLSYRQIGKLADDVCFARAHAKFPHWSKTPRLTTKELNDFALDEMPHFNELLHCLLTEAPIRYCSNSQRSMITAEIAMYFRGLEYGNELLAKHRAELMAPPGPGRLASEFGPQVSELNRANRLEFAADPRILAAIEARLRDRSLTRTERDVFEAAAPPPVRQQFASAVPSTPACPAQPWWAFWRSL